MPDPVNLVPGCSLCELQTFHGCPIRPWWAAEYDRLKDGTKSPIWRALPWRKKADPVDKFGEHTIVDHMLKRVEETPSAQHSLDEERIATPARRVGAPAPDAGSVYPPAPPHGGGDPSEGTQ